MHDALMQPSGTHAPEGHGNGLKLTAGPMLRGGDPLPLSLAGLARADVQTNTVTEILEAARTARRCRFLPSPRIGMEGGGSVAVRHCAVRSGRCRHPCPQGSRYVPVERVTPLESGLRRTLVGSHESGRPVRRPQHLPMAARAVHHAHGSRGRDGGSETGTANTECR